ncbi:MAG: thiamine pyrophosphate-binding protein, partial [Synergistota bacterium]|nr:thiamine pyrophosphate-binding protein [Synergistota bacterium]
MTETTGGQRVAGALEACGVTTIFGIPGIHNLDIYEALATSSIRHVTARHEQGAGFMADGYARSTGETGVALVISGPGLTNILTPMAQALHDSVPMLVISSQIPSAFLGKGAGFLHELKNSTIMAGSCAKDSRTVGSPRDIGPAIAAGLRLAAEGRPGPVHIEIPMDILAAGSAGEILSKDFQSTPWAPEAPDEALERAAALLSGAQKPLILAGGGARNAGPQLLALSEKLAAPVLESCAGKGVVDENHPLCLGARSHFDPVRKRMAESDVILAVGTELSPTDLWEQPFPVGGTLIQVDLDPANFDRNGTADLGLRGDAATTADALLNRLTGPDKHTEKTEREVAGLVSACLRDLD